MNLSEYENQLDREDELGLRAEDLSQQFESEGEVVVNDTSVDSTKCMRDEKESIEEHLIVMHLAKTSEDRLEAADAIVDLINARAAVLIEKALEG